MRPTPNMRLEEYRRIHPKLGASVTGDNWGYFEVPQICGTLRIIASDGLERQEEGWEHVSVSLADRCPTWEEMQFVKELFWGPGETVLQFHPRADAYVNRHPYCLHLWRRRGQPVVLPPRHLIG